MAKLTESHLRKIIKEELRKVLQLEGYTIPSMTADEVQKAFADAIKSGNGIVKQYLEPGSIPTGSERFVAKNNHFNSKVEIIPLEPYQAIQDRVKSTGPELHDELARAGIIRAKLPYDIADILKNYGLKIF